MAPSLSASVASALRLLRGWSPRSDPAAILELSPGLILRLPRYYDGFEFFQLPIDVQNVMAVGGGGGGALAPPLPVLASHDFSSFWLFLTTSIALTAVRARARRHALSVVVRRFRGQQHGLVNRACAHVRAAAAAGRTCVHARECALPLTPPVWRAAPPSLAPASVDRGVC